MPEQWLQLIHKLYFRLNIGKSSQHVGVKTKTSGDEYFQNVPISFYCRNAGNITFNQEVRKNK